jgi:hypothetical protein
VRFREVVLSDAAIQTVQARVRQRILRWFARQDSLDEENAKDMAEWRSGGGSCSSRPWGSPPSLGAGAKIRSRRIFRAKPTPKVARAVFLPDSCSYSPVHSGSTPGPEPLRAPACAHPRYRMRAYRARPGGRLALVDDLDPLVLGRIGPVPDIRDQMLTYPSDDDSKIPERVSRQAVHLRVASYSFRCARLETAAALFRIGTRGGDGLRTGSDPLGRAKATLVWPPTSAGISSEGQAVQRRRNCLTHRGTHFSFAFLVGMDYSLASSERIAEPGWSFHLLLLGANMLVLSPGTVSRSCAVESEIVLTRAQETT